MDDIVKKLRVLLDYWIEHNNEHQKEFEAWADRVAALSQQASKCLEDAANNMAAASKHLAKALQILEQWKEGQGNVYG